jgi:hypothetical protein
LSFQFAKILRRHMKNRQTTAHENSANHVAVQCYCQADEVCFRYAAFAKVERL